MISLAGLNTPQRSAAECVEGPVLILAGAGSGKTRTITYRIAHMVDNLGISPKQILAVSFTNKAAREMKERVIGLLGKSKSRGMTLATFHSLGVRILKNELDKLGYHKNFSIYDQNDQLAIIREALKNYRAEKEAYKKEDILSRIGLLKNNGLGPDDYSKSEYFNEEDPYDLATEYCYHYYQDKLKFYNAIDFDDILHLTVRLFEAFPEVAKSYSERFKYVMVDEYQDTNDLQFRLIMGLTSTHDNLCVVGDDDQSIYSFRGANIQNILDFEKNFPSAKVIKLEENYRSTSPILELANAVIRENKERRDKTLWSQKKSDFLPHLWAMGDTDHEAAVVIDEISKHQARGGFLGEVAILYRSNTQAQVFEEALRLAQVPYRLVGGQKFYEKKEVKDLIAYLSVIQNPHDQLALRRILNIPNRGIGTATLEKYVALSTEHNTDLFTALEQNPAVDPRREVHIREFCQLIRRCGENFKAKPLPEALSLLIEDIDYLKFIEKNYDSAKQVDRRKNDIMVFMESVERFLRYYKQAATLENLLERLLLQDSTDSDEDEDDDVKKNEVTLMTLHSSKGLEFDIVYLVGMEEECLPHKKTVREGGGLAEERRLAYVGITRAREKLFMTYCKERSLYGKKTPRFKSRFVENLIDSGLFVQQDRTTFSHMSAEEEAEYKKDFFAGLMNVLGDD